MSKGSPEILAASPWWDPRVYQDRRARLKARGKMQEAARHFFNAQGFTEADTPILQISPGNETHISCFATEIIDASGKRDTLYLHSSPEFTVKKLLAAGEKRIFTFAHVFRNRERGPLHHPEFTMLEWYRADEAYQRLMEDCAGLLSATAHAIGAKDMTYRGKIADPFAEPEVLSVAEAFGRYAGIDLLATYTAEAQDFEALAKAARACGIRIAPDDTWSDLFSKILSEKIEPHLGNERPTILADYPAPEAALARLQADKRFAERFELYVCGVEIANGFGELTEPLEQRRRFEVEMKERLRIYGEAYPLDEDFLDALAIMPQASGIALGFDRLVMLATGASHITDVLWAPVAEPK